jgi:hypothetical protein
MVASAAPLTRHACTYNQAAKPYIDIVYHLSRLRLLQSCCKRCRCQSRVDMRVMQVNQLLELEDRQQGTEKYTAIHKWASQLEALQNTLANKLL